VWIWIKMAKIKKVLLEEQEARRVKKVETESQAQAMSMNGMKSPFERRAEEEPAEFAMQPTQPTRMV